MGLLDRFRRRGTPATSAELDALVIRQLVGAGADLTKPRHVIHFLYFDDEASARAADDQIGAAGYETTVRPPGEVIEQWSVRAETHRVVTSSTVEVFRTWFERVASEHGGEYDGWEAAAEP
jgi:hypothetical protein